MASFINRHNKQILISANTTLYEGNNDWIEIGTEMAFNLKNKTPYVLIESGDIPRAMTQEEKESYISSQPKPPTLKTKMWVINALDNTITDLAQAERLNDALSKRPFFMIRLDQGKLDLALQEVQIALMGGDINEDDFNLMASILSESGN